MKVLELAAPVKAATEVDAALVEKLRTLVELGVEDLVVPAEVTLGTPEPELELITPDVAVGPT